MSGNDEAAYYAFKSPYYIVGGGGQDSSGDYHPDDLTSERFNEFLAKYMADRKESIGSSEQWSDSKLTAAALTFYKEYVSKDEALESAHMSGQLALTTTSKPPVIKKENLKLIKKMLNAFLKKRPPIERLKHDGIIKG